MTDYEPGTVAIATVRGVKGVRVWKMASGTSWAIDLVMDGPPGSWRDIVGAEVVADIRPLVVLDLDAAPYGKTAYYDQWLLNSAEVDERESSSANSRPAFLRWIADQIKAQTKLARISEPGEWGVVEASCVHQDGRLEWVRKDGNWHPVEVNGLRQSDDWNSLIDPKLIREGIEQ